MGGAVATFAGPCKAMVKAVSERAVLLLDVGRSWRRRGRDEPWTRKVV